MECYSAKPACSVDVDINSSPTEHIIHLVPQDLGVPSYFLCAQDPVDMKEWLSALQVVIFYFTISLFGGLFFFCNDCVKYFIISLLVMKPRNVKELKDFQILIK